MMETELDRLKNSLESQRSRLKTAERLKALFKRQGKSAKKEIKRLEKELKNARKKMKK